MSSVNQTPPPAQLRYSAQGTVAFVSPSGWGNLGDAAIIESLIHAIRQRHPGARIIGFTLNSPDTEERHGIPAYTCTGVSIPTQWVTDERPVPIATETSGQTSDNSISTTSLRGLLSNVPGLRALWRLLRTVGADLRHYRLSTGRLAGCEMVVIAGGGQLDDFFGGPFGHPFTLWKWARLARRVHARFVILSTGVGSLSTALSRYFVRKTLAMADYRSLRDQRSVDMCRAMGLLDTAAVVPDLAFGLPLSSKRNRGPAESGAKLEVAISPMAWSDPREWPVKDASRYSRFIQALAQLASHVVRQGHSVVLYTSDASDSRAVDDLLAQLATLLDESLMAQVRPASTTTLATLMPVLARADIAVSARLHGVMLAHLAGCPTLAIAHERKVATLMQELGHERFCFDIEQLDAAEAAAAFEAMCTQAPTLAKEIEQFVSNCRQKVEQQYETVFGMA